ncbi:MAG: hypothetical protein IT313_08975 [Anaerolineales bacterium]|nr:hypothetical protein [Anaerolineales bacterium]
MGFCAIFGHFPRFEFSLLPSRIHARPHATNHPISASKYMANIHKNKILIGLLIVYAIVLCQYLEHDFINFGIDWRETYYPALTLLLKGQSPYSITTLHNPIWALFPLIPFALLGEQAGKIFMFFAAFGTYAYAAQKLDATPTAILLYMTSPLMVYNLMLSNIDWLVVLGFIMPPAAGLFFVLLKPQIGIAVAMYWLWTSYKSGGIKNVGRIFLPVTIFTVMSFLLFGNWITGKSDNLLSASWNLSFFPYSVPIGLVLLYRARKNKKYAISASPFFSPYMSFGSWSIAQLGLVGNNLLTFAITSGLWIMYIILSLIQ